MCKVVSGWVGGYGLDSITVLVHVVMVMVVVEEGPHWLVVLLVPSTRLGSVRY